MACREAARHHRLGGLITVVNYGYLPLQS